MKQSINKRIFPVSYTFDKEFRDRLDKNINSTTNLSTKFRRNTSQATEVQSKNIVHQEIQLDKLASENDASCSFLLAKTSIPPSSRNIYDS